MRTRPSNPPTATRLPSGANSSAIRPGPSIRWANVSAAVAASRTTNSVAPRNSAAPRNVANSFPSGLNSGRTSPFRVRSSAFVSTSQT